EFINWSEGYPKLAGGILLAPSFGLDVREFIDEHTRWGKETPVIAIQYILLREPGYGELSALLRPVAGFTALQDTLASGRREFWGAVSSALARRGVTEHALSILERNESLRIRIRMQRYATINVSASIRYRRLVVAVVVPNSQQAGPANLAAIAGRLRLPGLPPPQHIKMPQCDGYYFNLTEQQLANNEVPSCEPETVAEKLIELKQLTEAIFTDQPPA
ncbi:MAG: hypothetical protein OXC81_07240, partial [Betaproteobacteria bacterium]|nr:hypothetical protein [Betaproteobacteria bacterium]